VSEVSVLFREVVVLRVSSAVIVTFSRAVLVKKAQLHEGRSSADVRNGLIRTLSQQAREEEREL